MKYVLGLYFLLFPVFAAGTVIEHSGSTDPQTEGWNLVSLDDGPGSIIVSGGLDPIDNSTEHWSISTSNQSRADYHGLLSTTDISTSDGWTAVARLRAELNPAPFPNDVRLEVDDGQSRWQLVFVTSGLTNSPGIFLNSPSSTSLVASVPDLSSAYTTVRLALRRGSAADLPTSGLNSDDVVDVLYQGNVIGTFGRSDSFPSDGAAIRFGDNASIGSQSAQSRWNYVAFNTGYQIPEPTTAFLAMLAFGFFSAARKRTYEIN